MFPKQEFKIDTIGDARTLFNYLVSRGFEYNKLHVALLRGSQQDPVYKNRKPFELLRIILLDTPHGDEVVLEIPVID